MIPTSTRAKVVWQKATSGHRWAHNVIMQECIGGIRGYTPYTNLWCFLAAYTYLICDNKTGYTGIYALVPAPIRQTRQMPWHFLADPWIFFTSFETIESRGQRFKLDAREDVEGMREFVADKPALIPERLKNLHACRLNTLQYSRMRTSLQSNEYYIDWSTLHHPGQKPVQFNACEPQRSTSSYVASRILGPYVKSWLQFHWSANETQSKKRRHEDADVAANRLKLWLLLFCDLLFWAGCDLTVWNSDNVVLCYTTLKSNFWSMVLRIFGSFTVTNCHFNFC